MGLGVAFQKPCIVPKVSVIDNMRLASERASLRSGVCASALNLDQLLESVEMDRLKDHASIRLSHGQRKLLEVLCALSSKPLVTLLDEPFAGLGERPGRLLSGLLLAHSPEMAIVLIEHRLPLLEALDPVVSVLNGGKIQIVSSLQDCEKNPEFQSIYLGIHE
jgi:branched-chain amino acid transport system ATP-binding protein